MKKIASVFAVMVVIVGLGAGCGKAEKPEAGKTEPVKADNANDGSDHSGHNH